MVLTLKINWEDSRGQKFLDHLSYESRKDSLLLLIPVSRVTLLQLLISYRTVYHRFIGGSVTHLVMQETTIL